jgi:hypothetical protein
MKDFVFKGIKGFPEVIGNWESGSLEITGEANPDNVFELFVPLNHWIKKYLDNNPLKLTIKFNLTYVNTSFSLIILDLIRQISASSQYKAKILWYYHEDDEDIYEQGDDYKSIASFPFELISI